ncbi:MAG: TAXI family TRAP transporter solute-binding subunit [Hyphomicrobiaceae bacterium]
MHIGKLAIASGLAVALTAGAAAAGEVKLPKQISWTAYGTTSSGYAQSVGIGQMLKKNYDIGLRIIPGKNDVSRMVPLRSGQTPLCACGIAAYMAAEGSHMFGTKKWGPMRLYSLFNNIGDNGYQLVAAGDAGIKKPSDLKGKRVTWVKGAPALNINAAAHLAWGGLTWDDVTKVVVPGWKQSAEAVINGQADATYGSTVSGAYNKLAASPRGLFWTAFPHDNKDAWARAQKVAPWWSPTMVKVAIDGEKNTTGKKPYPGNVQPYPIFVSTPKGSDDLAYGLTKAVMDRYEEIKDSGPSMSGYQIARQNLQWVFPYHPGAIKYFKEKGKWTAAEEAHNKKMLQRQDILAGAWKAYSSANKDKDDAAFNKGWQAARAGALEKASMDVPFKTWE